jgi:hypothetical protein
LPIAPGARYVDLGRGPDGTPVAVYARCPYETKSPVGAPHYFIYSRLPVQPPLGCDLYLYDFATAVERKLDAPSTVAGSEYLPTISGDRIAFVRVYSQRKGRAGLYPHIYVSRLDGRGKTIRIPGGPRGVYDLDEVGIGTLAFGGVGPIGLDLHGNRLAWTWEWSPDHSRVITEVHMTRIGGHQRVLERATTSRLKAKNVGPLSDARVDALIAPTLTARAIFYARWRNRGPSNYVRRSLQTNHRSTAPGPSSRWQPTTLAAIGSTFYYSTLEGAFGSCRFLTASPPPDEDLQRCLVRKSKPVTFR